MTHIIEGEFQSDKYPTTPRGKVPLSTKDPAAQDLLWQYAQRRRAVELEGREGLQFQKAGGVWRELDYLPATPSQVKAETDKASHFIVSHTDGKSKP